MPESEWFQYYSATLSSDKYCFQCIANKILSATILKPDNEQIVQNTNADRYRSHDIGRTARNFMYKVTDRSKSARTINGLRSLTVIKNVELFGVNKNAGKFVWGLYSNRSTDKFKYVSLSVTLMERDKLIGP